MQNRKSVIGEDQKEFKSHNNQIWVIRKDSSTRVTFELEPKASRKLGQVDICI